MSSSKRGKKKKYSSRGDVTMTTRYKSRGDIREQFDTEIRECTARYEHINKGTAEKFTDFPLSNRTISGLEIGGFVNMTEIQKQAIPPCLRGKDVQAEAITGSGKTLGFLVPLLECLWREKWSPCMGVGALVITPTRELAYQIYEVLKKVGARHDFSAGLVIGGKSLVEEQDRIGRTNIVIATPGRLLQHMDQTVGFHCDDLQMLVLDEADRILDLGFSTAMKCIVENLPAKRQTLLFSATLTNKSVVKLANLSLNESVTVSTALHKTPTTLSHSYLTLELQEKLEVLYAFIKSHLNCKILVFMSSCKQVQYHNAVLCKLRPGLPILALYGKQKQLRRVGIYESFCRKTAAVLLATDIAARGLDIPAVSWVVHLDCPEDADTYIHRAGRTARYYRAGNSLLLLLRSEEGMIGRLGEQGVTLTKIRVNPQKQVSIQKKVESLCAESPEIHHWARRCFVSYVRSVFLQHDKTLFKVQELPLAAYAASLGLMTAPKVRFLKKGLKLRGQQEQEEEETRASGEDEERSITLDEDESELLVNTGSSRVESLSVSHLEAAVPRQPRARTKVAKAKALIRKGIKTNTKIVFDDEGNVAAQEGVFSAPGKTPLHSQTTTAGSMDWGEMEREMGLQDRTDKLEERRRRKEAKILRKEKKRERRVKAEGDPGVTIGGGVEEEEEKPAKKIKLEDLAATERLANQLLGDL